MRRHVSRLPSKRDQDKNQALGSLVSWSLAGGEDSLKISLCPAEKNRIYFQDIAKDFCACDACRRGFAIDTWQACSSNNVEIYTAL
jgi:hypothetical protein